ncbi:hypothetical protein MasN3_05350 [Massilia varians]|uniref:Site-specific DNA-methyltransferase (adenine-specific) n=1 Tax=Massilia varians TaxID=457921 RepID=A0ABN6T9X3_9BURK|nr:hypothetical protein MasN3_05350 [Massilia varians]
MPIEVLSVGSPVLHPELLTKWPASQDTVVGLNSAILDVFDGPRVLFPDGFSRGEQNVRAVYYDGPASFTHSVGVIAGKAEHALLLQFVAVYLRSSLARYFLMIRGWKMLCERNGVHLADVETFPFFIPEDAPDPVAAKAALETVSECMAQISDLAEWEQKRCYEELRSTLDQAVFDYFGLSSEEQALVSESVDVLMPSIRPRSFKSLDTPAQRSASPANVERYATALAESLTSWRKRTGGEGRFSVNVTVSDPNRAGPSGIVRIKFAPQPTSSPEIETEVDSELVLETLALLRDAGFRAIPSGNYLTLVPDIHLWMEGALYLVRPLALRSWTIRQALRDAEHVVRTVQLGAVRTVQFSTVRTVQVGAMREKQETA